MSKVYTIKHSFQTTEAYTDADLDTLMSDYAAFVAEGDGQIIAGSFTQKYQTADEIAVERDADVQDYLKGAHVVSKIEIVLNPGDDNETSVINETALGEIGSDD